MPWRRADDRPCEHGARVGWRGPDVVCRLLGARTRPQSRPGAPHLPGALHRRMVGLRVWRTGDFRAARPRHGRRDPGDRCSQSLGAAARGAVALHRCYRYVWDARVSSAGIDPYAYAPVAPEVAGLRDADIYPRLNHSTWRTVYPPAAQALFGAVYRVAPDNVFALKVAFGLAELLALAAL